MGKYKVRGQISNFQGVKLVISKEQEKRIYQLRDTLFNATEGTEFHQCELIISIHFPDKAQELIGTYKPVYVIELWLSDRRGDFYEWTGSSFEEALLEAEHGVQKWIADNGICLP